MNFVGKRIIIRYESGLEVQAHYKSATELLWQALSGPSKGTTGSETIHAAEVAPDLFFISWLENSGVSVSNILDLNNSRMLAYVTFDTEQGRQSHFDQGTIADLQQQ